MSTPEDNAPAASEGAPASDDAVFASDDDGEMVTDSGAAEDAPLTDDPLDEPGAAGEPQITDSGAAPAEPVADDAVEAAPAPDWQDRYLREAAELDNVRKRARRDVAAAEARGIAKLAKELLPALDDLERALASAEAEESDQEHHLTRGIRLVQQQLLQSLQRIGIQADSPKGEKFDPHRHEALAQQPAPEGTEKGVVLDVYQPGYVYADTVLRAAKVIVAN